MKKYIQTSLIDEEYDEFYDPNEYEGYDVECYVCGSEIYADDTRYVDDDGYAVCAECAAEEAKEKYTHSQGLAYIASDEDIEQGFYLEWLYNLDTAHISSEDKRKIVALIKEIIAVKLTEYAHRRELESFCLDNVDEYTEWYMTSPAVIDNGDYVVTDRYFEYINTNEIEGAVAI